MGNLHILCIMRDKKLRKIDEYTYLGALKPYFELIKNEYNNERNRKQSLETKSGIMITVIITMATVIFNKIKFKDIFVLFSLPLTFYLLIKIIIGLLIYLSFFLCIFFLFKTLYTASYATFNVDNISSQTLGNLENIALGNIIIDYKNIIVENRNINDKKAKAFECAITFMIICSISVCIFINI